LRVHRAQIDDANVYPVPDGDTGTNLVTTVEAVAGALDGVPDRAPDVARAIVRGSLAGARGNSGVILAQWLRGFCEAFEHETEPSAEDVATALKHAAELAWQSMLQPREGTILTVARAAAEAAHGSAPDVAGVLEAAAAAGRDALAHTPDLLPVLRAEGVVDAGGIGLCVVLDALFEAATGRRADPFPALAGPRPVRPRETGSIEFAYEVQYLLEAPDDAVHALRERLGAIGDSVAVVGGDGSWNVHVHTNDVGHAIELGVEVGLAHAISVVEFEEQIAETRGLPLAVSPSPVAVITAVEGDGLRAVFEELGAVVSYDLAAGVSVAQAPDVIVLTNGVEYEEPEDLRGRTVEVLRTHDPAEGFAAMLAYAPERGLLDNLAEMRASIARTRTAIAHHEKTLRRAVQQLGDGEVLTVFVGAAVGAEERDRVAKKLAELPFEADVRDGGQPSPRYLIALE
jgi:DAK2 domain fusion protein YloV